MVRNLEHRFFVTVTLWYMFHLFFNRDLEDIQGVTVAFYFNFAFTTGPRKKP